MVLPVKDVARDNVIVEALDDIISKNPQPELIGYWSQLLDSKPCFRYCFGKMLSITNTLLLVLQAHKKVFGAIRRAMNSTIPFLRKWQVIKTLST